MRAPGKGKGQRIARPVIRVRLNGQITLEAQADGNIAVGFGGQSIGLGKLSPVAAKSAQELRTGLPLDRIADKEVDSLVRRLARRGLVEYGLGPGRDGNDLVVIEPQVPDYWPQAPVLADTETLVLSRFAYLRRRGDEMVLESPRAGALFRICDSGIAAALAALSKPQQIKKLRRQQSFPGKELLAVLVGCDILFRTDAAAGEDLRAAEGDGNLVLWDFHDLLFHTHSTEGRQANPLGGLYPYAGMIPPPPAIRPRWPGKKIDLDRSAVPAEGLSPFVTLLHRRRSIRDFDDKQPITLAELGRFLENTARVQSTWKSRLDGNGPMIAYTTKLYPSGGSAYELELYLSVANCKGLPRGFYHYDAERHALVPIDVRDYELDAQLRAAEFAMDAPGTPQILITLAARFDRISWKYRSIAYSLILKDVGVLLQTLYLMATEMGLGGCAIGSLNIGLFAEMTGIEFHVEGPVGLFALGRGSKSEEQD